MNLTNYPRALGAWDVSHRDTIITFNSIIFIGVVLIFIVGTILYAKERAPLAASLCAFAAIYSIVLYLVLRFDFPAILNS